MAQNDTAKNGNGGNLGFEADLFKTADKLRGNMEPSDYKHVALGLIFLKYISDAFEARHKTLLAEDPQAAEDKDEYLADNVFWVPKDARWSHLQANAKLPTIGTLIDDAMRAIEKDNESLKGVLPKDYARPALNKVMLGELIDLISGIALNEEGHASRDILGRVYEYFLGQFAGSEGKRGGEFYTPAEVVRLLVQITKPQAGHEIYDPTLGSGGFLIQAHQYVEEQGQDPNDLALYGQEVKGDVWSISVMTMLLHNVTRFTIENGDTLEDPLLLEGNNLRKFLEAFLFFKFPHHDDKSDAFERIKKFFGEEDSMAIALVNRLNNEFSHLESIPDRGFKPVEIPEIAKVANFVLDKIYAADPLQYNALLKSIGEPARTH